MKQPSNLWNEEEGNKKATRDLNFLFDGLKIFDHPKPIGLMQRIITLATSANGGDIVLDFFAGSGTIAHAIWQQNYSDQGDRKFILVQLPERLDEEIKSHQVAAQLCNDIGLPKNVAELSKERLRRTIRLFQKNDGLGLGVDVGNALGFKVFKLDKSTFNIWNGSAEEFNDNGSQLDLHVNHVDETVRPTDILYELLLKAGFKLTTPVDVITLAGLEIFSVGQGALLICLQKEITPELIDALAQANPLQVICLDEGFKGNDQLKANAVQTFKARAQAEESEIVFRTV